MKHHLLTMLLAVVCPAPALAQAGSAVVTAPAGNEVFDHVAELLVPRDRLRDLIEPLFMLSFDEAVATNVKARAILQRHPGMRESILATLKPELLAAIDWTYNGMRTDIRNVVAAEFTPSEARVLTNFLSSPAGSKLYGGALKMGVERIADETSGRPEQLDKNAKVALLMRQMTPEDVRAIEAFGNSSAGVKFGILASRIKPISETWTERMVQEHGPRLTKRTRDAIQQHVETQSDIRK